MAMTSSMMRSATLAARFASASAPGRGSSRVGEGVIREAYPATDEFLRLDLALP
jgi:hypothetical protein